MTAGAPWEFRPRALSRQGRCKAAARPLQGRSVSGLDARLMRPYSRFGPDCSQPFPRSCSCPSLLLHQSSPQPAFALFPSRSKLFPMEIEPVTV